MKYRFSILILLLIMLCSCAKGKSKADTLGVPELNLKSGLVIKNGINRGTSYTDSAGVRHNIRYIPIKITNDSTVPIHFKLGFKNPYKYPTQISDTIFKLIPLSKEWAIDGSELTDKMYSEIPNLVDKPSLSETINPGDTLILGIGTVYPLPAKVCGVLPLELHTRYTLEQTRDYDQFITRLADGKTSEQQLWLKLDYCRNSDKQILQLISCGTITYP